MNDTEIQDRVEDILADINDLATDTDLSTGEILIKIFQAMIEEYCGQGLTVEEKAKATTEFLQALQQKADAGATC